ncbi:MAG: class I SAM-dependent methyltransferase [bacterium]|nr:class I SAM-dependent methyltransferase [bacterium]
MSDKETIEVYKQLGKKYCKNIELLYIAELYKFMKLLPKNGEVLDVGCAGGRDTEEFIKNGFQVTGIDLVDEFLEGAKKFASEGRFIKMDVENLQFPSNYFDGIYAAAVLLHVAKNKIPAILAIFHRILKADGILFIGVKEGYGEKRVADDTLAGGLSRFYSFFSKEELTQLLKQAGFDIIFSRNVPDEAGRSEVHWIRIIARKQT